MAAKKSAAFRVCTKKPDYSAVPVSEFDWECIYGKTEEVISGDIIPEHLEKLWSLPRTLTRNLLHCLVTGRSISGILHLLNKTPVDWFSKKQNTVETVTYGSEYTAARIAVDQIIDLRFTTTLVYLLTAEPTLLVTTNLWSGRPLFRYCQHCQQHRGCQHRPELEC